MDPKATAKTAEHRPCTECGRLNSFEARFCGACGNELVSESQALGNEVMADPLIGRIIADRYRILQFWGAAAWAWSTAWSTCTSARSWP
ncbi:MAG: hypothetical protein IPN77_28395 [Sandaracinaceae bacterium]|nr:hypothetical protein [Sandaracinaceae bacterium]